MIEVQLRPEYIFIALCLFLVSPVKNEMKCTVIVPLEWYLSALGLFFS